MKKFNPAWYIVVVLGIFVAAGTYSGIALAQPSLVEQGRQLFFNETFGGNGRTCGTCHRATVPGLTITKEFIATLPQDDPLFVAETNPALAGLENPLFMRAFGLILENLDGFNAPPVFRSVPHMLGLARTAPFGLSADGAPDPNSLKSFAIGAVRQHFPRTLARVPGVDFRLPTEDELTALEAFQASLGRLQEMDFEAMRFTNEQEEKGRRIFVARDSQGGTVKAGKCIVCHVDRRNENFNTGVEKFRRPLGVPLDDGRGTPGDGTFNPPSLMEAADTAPFFHNSSAATLEEAIKFYDTDAFKKSPAALALKAADSGGRNVGIETGPLAAFLRAINRLSKLP
jgi:cytochrome c peroxidase